MKKPVFIFDLGKVLVDYNPYIIINRADHTCHDNQNGRQLRYISRVSGYRINYTLRNTHLTNRF